MQVGEVVKTMCVGHIVEAEFVEIDPDDAYQPYVCRFRSHHPSGDKRLCLDIGQRWYIEEGDLFHCHPGAFQAAAEYIAKGL